MSFGADADWLLDSRLARDSIQVCDLALSQVRLMSDANYPWLLLLPRLSNVTELIDLTEKDRAQLMREVSRAVKVLKSQTHCDKINVASIGNVVAQLHVHVVARFHNDAAWPKPVWGVVPPRAYEPGAAEKLAMALAAQFR